MANVDNPNGFTWVGTTDGSVTSPRLWSGTLLSNTTITKGDALIIASGQVSIAANTSGTIVGVANESVTGATSVEPTIEFIPATDNNLFEAQCSGTFALTSRYVAVDIEGTTGIMEVNEDATTEKVFQILDLKRVSGNAVGANARVVGIFPRSSFTGTEDAE